MSFINIITTTFCVNTPGSKNVCQRFGSIGSFIINDTLETLPLIVLKHLNAVIFPNGVYIIESLFSYWRQKFPTEENMIF